MTPTDQHWSDYYSQDKDFTLISSRSITKLLSYADNDLSKTHLDIGCGTGQLTRELYHRGYNCLGVDASAKAIEIAKSLSVQEGLTYQHFDIETDDSIGLPNQPYSLITCKLVYAFIKDKPKFLAQVAELLSERGVFAVITPLVSDVPPEKVGIAVDPAQTTTELQGTFGQVQLYKRDGLAYFVCGR